MNEKKYDQIEIKLITSTHIDSISAIHMIAFKERALTSLGEESVRRYYQWLLNGPHPNSSTFGAFSGEKLLGYCFSGKFNGAVTGFIRKNWFYLSLYIISHPWLLVFPLIRDRLGLTAKIIRIHWLSRQEQTNESDFKLSEGIKSFGLEIIAVDPRVQKKGVGHFLMVEMERLARINNCGMMHLSVDKNNTNAVRFYEKEGWSQKLDEKGVWHGKMHKLFSEN